MIVAMALAGADCVSVTRRSSSARQGLPRPSEGCNLRVYMASRRDIQCRSQKHSTIITDATESDTPVTEIIVSGSKATVATWAPLSDFILTGHESGMIAKYDVKTGAQVEYVGSDEGHRGEITDIQLSPDGTYFITSSKDKTARVCLFTLRY